MTTYAWPGGSAFAPNHFELRILPNPRVFTGTYSPDTQALDFLGERWIATIGLPATTNAIEAAAREAFFDRLKGPINLAQLWHLKRSAPLGTARGTMTVQSSVAQLANTCNIAGATVAPNLLMAPCAFDNAAWQNAWGGTSVIVADVVAGYDGTGGGDKMTSSSGTAARAQAVSVVNGLQYTFSIFAARVAGGTESTSIGLQIRDGVGGGASILQSGSLTLLAAGGGYARNSITWTSDRTGTVYVGPTGIAAGQSGAYLWGAQFEQAASATSFSGIPTLRAGDMLSINGQLVRVLADSADAIGIEFAPRARVAWSAGASIVWSSPTANFMLKGNGVPVPFVPGYADQCQFDLVEVP